MAEKNEEESGDAAAGLFASFNVAKVWKDRELIYNEAASALPSEGSDAIKFWESITGDDQYIALNLHLVDVSSKLTQIRISGIRRRRRRRQRLTTISSPRSGGRGPRCSTVPRMARQKT